MDTVFNHDTLSGQVNELWQFSCAHLVNERLGVIVCRDCPPFRRDTIGAKTCEFGFGLWTKAGKMRERRSCAGPRLPAKSKRQAVVSLS